MNHLRLVGQVPIAPVLPALCEHQALWDAETWRQDHPVSPHTATRAIFLRMPPDVGLESVIHSCEVEDRPALAIPAFAHLVSAVAAELDAGDRLARVMLVQLRPYSRIPPHKDEGIYAQATERYHLAITTNAACVMQVASEVVHMLPGDVWWFDKHETHQVLNAGCEPRVHLIADVFHV